MIVPQFWAEHRAISPRFKKQRQSVVRRFGWSDTSQAEAEEMARKRAEEALAKLVSGTRTVARREPKIPYNGAEGVPIREEVLLRREDLVITRNSYGAQCLNTPDVAFADIDFEHRQRPRRVLAHGALLLLIGVCLSLVTGSLWVALISAFCVAALSLPFAQLTQYVAVKLKGGLLKLALNKVHAFSRRHPDWRLRLYRTPAGLRVLVQHRRFRADSPEIADFFTSLGVDPLYAKMCRNQQCFRARLTPKPWRIGMEEHLRPRPGVWPIKQAHLENRQIWIRRYETLSKAYAACSYLETLGHGAPDPKAAQVTKLHDELSQACSGRPIA